MQWPTLLVDVDRTTAHGVDDAAEALQELRRVVHGIRTASYAVERASGVTGAQLFVLRALAGEPGASIRRLAELTLTDPSSVSVLVARLVEAGLVTRTVDDADRRRTSLALSRRGKALLARAPAPYQGKLVEVLRALPSGEVQALRGTLARLADALGVAGEAPLFFEEKKPKERRPRAR